MGRPRNEDKECFVKVAKTGGKVEEYMLNGERTVEGALETAELDYDEDSRIRLNGKEADLGDEVKDGDVITLAGNIKGAN